MPAVDLTAPARLGVDELLDVLEKHAAAADEAGRPAPEVLAALRDSPLPGLVVPKSYGGAGADALESNRMIARIARHDPSTAIIAFQHMAVCSRIAEWGSDEQRAGLLPKLASGEWLAASAWSESGAGAAKKNLSTIADELPGGGWTVSGGKAFTTGAGITDIYLVLARVQFTAFMAHKCEFPILGDAVSRRLTAKQLREVLRFFGFTGDVGRRLAKAQPR